MRKRKVPEEKKLKIEQARERLDAIAKERAVVMNEIDVLSCKCVELATEAQSLMKYTGMDEYHVPGVGTHVFKPTAGKATNTVDPKGFKKLAGENAFWQVVKIGITEARKFLGSKELASITTTEPAKPGPAKYSFKP